MFGGFLSGAFFGRGGKHHPGMSVPASHPQPQAQPHLPGLTASPARVRRHPQPLAAGFLGQEGELAHSAADEGAQVDGGGLECTVTARQQQEKQSTQDHAVELHAEAEGREVEGWESQRSPGGKKCKCTGSAPELGYPFLPSDTLFLILIQPKRRRADV